MRGGEIGERTHEAAQEGGKVGVKRKWRRMPRWGGWVVGFWTLNCMGGVGGMLSDLSTRQWEAALMMAIVSGVMWVVGLGLLAAIWLTSQEKAEADDRGIEVRRLEWLWPSEVKVAWADVEGVHVSCDYWRRAGKEGGFSVGAKLKDGRYVRLVTGIGSVGEASEICAAVKGVMGGVVQVSGR